MTQQDKIKPSAQEGVRGVTGDDGRIGERARGELQPASGLKRLEARRGAGQGERKDKESAGVLGRPATEVTLLITFFFEKKG